MRHIYTKIGIKTWDMKSTKRIHVRLAKQNGRKVTVRSGIWRFVLESMTEDPS